MADIPSNPDTSQLGQAVQIESHPNQTLQYSRSNCDIQHLQVNCQAQFPGCDLDASILLLDA